MTSSKKAAAAALIRRGHQELIFLSVGANSVPFGSG